MRGSEGLPSRAYSLAGKTRVRAHIRENNTVHLAVPFQFIKHPHTSPHKRGGKGLVLFSRCGNFTGGQALSEWQGWSRSSGVSLASDHCSEWQRHATGSEGFVGPKDRGLGKGRAVWGRLHGTAGLLRVDGAQSK